MNNRAKPVRVALFEVVSRAGIAWSGSSVLSMGEIGSWSSPLAKERA
jgi:hypothetical protein